MGPNTCYLITLLADNNTLIRCELKAKEEVKYYMEQKGQAELMAQLPKHCQSIGPIVHVGELFEVHESI